MRAVRQLGKMVEEVQRKTHLNRLNTEIRALGHKHHYRNVTFVNELIIVTVSRLKFIVIPLIPEQIPMN